MVSTTAYVVCGAAVSFVEHNEKSNTKQLKQSKKNELDTKSMYLCEI